MAKPFYFLLFFGDPLASAQRLHMYCHQGLVSHGKLFYSLLSFGKHTRFFSSLIKSLPPSQRYGTEMLHFSDRQLEMDIIKAKSQKKEEKGRKKKRISRYPKRKKK